MQRLDEVQSYVLLRRWQSDNKGDHLASQLTAAQLESIMDFYSMERSYAGESQKLLIQLSQSEPYTCHQYSAAVGSRYAECSLAPWLCNVEHKQRWGWRVHEAEGAWSLQETQDLRWQRHARPP